MSGTFLEIDLNALRHNYTYLKSKLSSGVKVMAVVKAFGYGSDACSVALELEKLGVHYFAVAYTLEGVALRNAGITAPVLVLHPQPENFGMLIERCLEPSLYSARIFQAFNAFAKAQKQKKYPIHIKFNTGLNRLGFWENDIDWIAKELNSSPSIKVASIFSHLAASEDSDEKEFTIKQINSFRNSAKKLCTHLTYTPFLHQSNTSAIINYPESQFDMVRAGIGLYGYGNSEKEDQQLQVVASLKSVISQLHKIEPGETVGYNRGYKAAGYETIATIPLGHADGIFRAFGKEKGYFSIQDNKAPIVGNVCMDMVMVNVTGINCKEGDVVEFFGKENLLPELASKIDSISYEILTAVSQRVKRVILR